MKLWVSELLWCSKKSAGRHVPVLGRGKEGSSDSTKDGAGPQREHGAQPADV